MIFVRLLGSLNYQVHPIKSAFKILRHYSQCSGPLVVARAEPNQTYELLVFQEEVWYNNPSLSSLEASLPISFHHLPSSQWLDLREHLVQTPLPSNPRPTCNHPSLNDG